MILDYIEKLELPESDREAQYEACMALARLSEGMAWLASEVNRIQNGVRSRANKERSSDGKVPIASIAGGIMDEVPLGILSGAFNWYAISACNYARLVGWMIYRDSKKARRYVGHVMPRLLLYRNKVAAHLAITEPYQTDNEADLAASLLTNVIFLQGYLFAAAIEPMIVRSGENVKVSNKMAWSLTIAHSRLSKRWWPNGIEKSYPSIRLEAGKPTGFEVDWYYITEDVV